jgi:hypothetical protein
LCINFVADMKFGTVPRKLKAVSNCWICEGWTEV